MMLTVRLKVFHIHCRQRVGKVVPIRESIVTPVWGGLPIPIPGVRIPMPRRRHQSLANASPPAPVPDLRILIFLPQARVNPNPQG